MIGHSLGEAARSRRRRGAVAGGRRAGDLPPLEADARHRRRRRDGIGGIARPAGAFRTDARGINDVVVAVVASPQSTVIGGATQTVRELVAAWEERDVMAREVAVDVASHSPQVDPILDDWPTALADVKPREPEVPYYSATLFDPREPADVRRRVLGGQPAPHGAVRRRGAGGARGRLPGLRRAVAAPAADPGRRPDRRQPRHTGRPRWPGCGASSAAGRAARLAWPICTAPGAAIDFSVLYPDGHLVDAPLPTVDAPSAAA